MAGTANDTEQRGQVRTRQDECGSRALAGSFGVAEVMTDGCVGRFASAVLHAGSVKFQTCWDSPNKLLLTTLANL